MSDGHVVALGECDLDLFPFADSDGVFALAALGLSRVLSFGLTVNVSVNGKRVLYVGRLPSMGGRSS